METEVIIDNEEQNEMVTIKKGNIFKEKVEAIVNPVNTVGVMGKGLALQFKKRYPEMFKEYRELCNQEHEFYIGCIHSYYVPNEERYTINFPTKKHWRDPSKLEYIEIGLDTLHSVIVENDIKSIAMPLLGCGLGGLNPNEVIEAIKKEFGNTGIDVVIVTL